MELKDRIIEVTTELFMETGIKSVTMDIIAETMGISKRTLYKIFSDKDQLVDECLTFIIEQNEAQMREMCTKTSNVIEMMMLLYLQGDTNSKNRNKNLIFDLKKFHPKTFERVKNQRERGFREYMTVELDKGIMDGYIRSDLNTEIMIILLREQFDMIERGHPELRIFPVSEVVKTIFMSFIRGISTSKGLKVIDDIMAGKVGERL